jgi:flagellar hook-length control protein FliK
VPVINTAKLIQSMGQSEMRVGMRSNDFGNISISTSATRNLISAQISLEHGELARTLATHLPEMQARLGGNQAMNVRIDMNGQPAGQSAGTSTGMSNGSADQSHGDRQQKGSTTANQSAEGFAGHLNSIPTAVLSSAEGRLDVRLDIRV